MNDDFEAAFRGPQDPFASLQEEAILRAWDVINWISPAQAAALLALGKREVWFDYMALLSLGWSGGDLEALLTVRGVTVHGKLVTGADGCVIVDPDHVETTRREFARLGIGGEL